MPPVVIAISSSIALRQWPNSGGWIAATLKLVFSRRASNCMITGGATSSAMISNGRPLFSISDNTPLNCSIGLNFVIGHQDERVVENDLHPLDIGDHVMREIAALEGHALDDFQRRLDGVPNSTATMP